MVVVIRRWKSERRWLADDLSTSAGQAATGAEVAEGLGTLMSPVLQLAWNTLEALPLLVSQPDLESTQMI